MSSNPLSMAPELKTPIKTFAVNKTNRLLFTRECLQLSGLSLFSKRAGRFGIRQGELAGSELLVQHRHLILLQ